MVPPLSTLVVQLSNEAQDSKVCRALMGDGGIAPPRGPVRAKVITILSLTHTLAYTTCLNNQVISASIYRTFPVPGPGVLVTPFLARSGPRPRQGCGPTTWACPTCPKTGTRSFAPGIVQGTLTVIQVNLGMCSSNTRFVGIYSAALAGASSGAMRRPQEAPAPTGSRGVEDT